MEPNETTREPAVVKSSVEAGNTGVELDPILTRKELNDHNPVIRQTREAQQAFGLPSHVVPTAAQMQHLSKDVRQERENEIVNNHREFSRVTEMNPEDVQILDDSMIARGGDGNQSGLELAKPAIRDPQANMRVLNNAFEKKKLGVIDETRQAAREDFANIENAITQDALQSSIDVEHLNNIESFKKERDRAAADITAMSKQFIRKKIDPSRWYENRTTGQKIGIAISAFLTGFGGSDATLKMVNNAINRDVAAQKDALARGGANVKNMMGMVTKIYGDNIDAEKYVRGIYLENVSNQLKINSAKAKSGAASSKLNSAISAIEIEKEKLWEDIGKGRMALRASTAKNKEPGVEHKKRETLLQSAILDFNDLERAFKKNINTFSVMGENEFTLAEKGMNNALGFFFSGANVPESEKETFRAMVPSYKDSAKIQKIKITKLRRKMQLYSRIQRATTTEELAAASGNAQRNKFFKPSK